MERKTEGVKLQKLFHQNTLIKEAGKANHFNFKNTKCRVLSQVLFLLLVFNNFPDISLS